MRIYIPTLGRITKQLTWEQLSHPLRARTYLVCPGKEVTEHENRGRNVLPCPAQGIAAVRQWLLDRETKKFCMCDDDHYFVRRVEPGKSPLRVCSEKDIEDMFRRIEILLDKYPLVGVSARQGNDTFLGRRTREAREIASGLAVNTRICNLYGVRADILKKYSIRYDAVLLMEDFHVALSLS
jgi:hypothetical protein